MYHTDMIQQFNKEFIKRHQFSSEDLNVLKVKYKNIKFESIPDAWIICIDNLLKKIKSDNIYKISQYNGIPIVIFSEDFSDNQSYVKKFEDAIMEIDIDLYEKYGLS